MDKEVAWVEVAGVSVAVFAQALVGIVFAQVVENRSSTNAEALVLSNNALSVGPP